MYLLSDEFWSQALSPRPYDNSRRRAEADETRERILKAADEMLASETGLSGFSLDAVSKKAGVARMTVYYQFSSRAGLLEALFDRRAATLAQRLPLAFRAEDPREAIARLVAAFCAFWSEDHTGMRRLLAAAGQDPEIEASIRARHERRRTALRALVGRLPATDPDGLVDLLYAMTGPGVWADLSASGRTPAEVEALLQATAAGLVDRFSAPPPS